LYFPFFCPIRLWIGIKNLYHQQQQPISFKILTSRLARLKVSVNSCFIMIIFLANIIFFK